MQKYISHMKLLAWTMWTGAMYTYNNDDDSNDNNADNTFWLHNLHLAYYAKSAKRIMASQTGW